MRRFVLRLRERTWIEWLVTGSIVTSLIVFFGPFGRDTSLPASSIPDTSLPASSMLGSEELSNLDESVSVIVSSVGERDDRGVQRIRLTLVNRSESPIDFFGYEPNSYSPRLGTGFVSPLYVRQFRNDADWVEKKGGWCGVGAGHIPLKPGRAGRFDAWIADEDRSNLEVRIGVLFQPHKSGPVADSSIAWSQPISLSN